MIEANGHTPRPAPEIPASGPLDVRTYLAHNRGLSPADIVDLMASDQIRRWQQGERVPAEAYLQLHPALAADGDEAFELVFAEIDLREQYGESPSLEEYQWRFPQFATRLRRQFELHLALRDETDAPKTDATSPNVSPELPCPGPSAVTRRFPTVPGYEISDELGRGGMGVVYLAKHVGLNRAVALKMILGGLLASPQAHARFLLEARAAASLQHPNIVQVYDVGEHDGCPFLSMELVKGGNLAQRLSATPQLPEDAGRLVEILARAIGRAHREGIIHRDLTPANVLLANDADTPFGQCIPRIADFGLAKQLMPALTDGLPATDSGAILGTPEYMAPEQVSRDHGTVGTTTDIYALGAILYEMLTGRPPFKAIDRLKTLTQLIDNEPVPPRQLQPQLPRDLETVCMKCLQKRPHQRYTTAQALADDLQRFREGKPVQARPVGLADRLWRSCRRKPAIASLLAVLLVTVLTALAVLLFLNRTLNDALAKAEDRDLRTRQILAEFVRPNRLSVPQRAEAHRKSDLARLKLAAEHYEALLAEEPDDLALQTALADVYVGIALLHYERWQLANTLGFTEKALLLWEPTQPGPNWLDWSYPNRMLTLYGSMSDQPARQHGPSADALAFNEKALRLWKQVVNKRPTDLQYRRSLAEAHESNGLLHRDGSEVNQAIDAFHRACIVWKELIQERPIEEHRYNLARVQRLLSEVLYSCGHIGEAFRLMDASQALLKRLCTEQPAEKRFVEHLAQNYFWRANVRAEQSFAAEALDNYEQAYLVLKEWLAKQPGSATANDSLAFYAAALVRPGAIEPYYTETVGPYETACKSFARLLEEQPGNSVLREQLELCYRILVSTHEAASKPDRTVETWERYIRLLEDMAKRSPSEDLGLCLGRAYAHLGVCYREAKDIEKAGRAAQQGFDMFEALLPKHDADEATASRRYQWAFAAWKVAHGLRRAGMPKKALMVAQQAEHLLLELGRESPQNTQHGFALYCAYDQIGRAQVTLGRPDEALTAYLNGVKVMRQVVERAPEDLGFRTHLARRCMNLSRHLRERHRLSEAADWLLEWEKLLPADALYQQQQSREFSLLASLVGQGRKELAPAELAERERYLRLSTRPATELKFWTPALTIDNP